MLYVRRGKKYPYSSRISEWSRQSSRSGHDEGDLRLEEPQQPRWPTRLSEYPGGIWFCPLVDHDIGRFAQRMLVRPCRNYACGCPTIRPTPLAL